MSRAPGHRDHRPSRSDLAVAYGRYRGLVDEWGAFLDALEAPHVPCVWANPARLAPDELASILRGQGLAPEPIPWSPGAFRLREATRPGTRWPYLAGLYHVQEEASLVPVQLLDPRPGERILDLCAAPGNKTAQIGTRLGYTGTVVANDRKAGRVAAIQHAIGRLGLINVTTTCVDGCIYPDAAGPFDRILVDAPCSAEGTVRRMRSAAPVADEFRRYVTGQQRALLRRALSLVRPGGRVVYSTCTFAPEENELVLDDVLARQRPPARLLPARIAGLDTAPGITEWSRRWLHPDLARCARLWPHRSDTGGFFVAVLERLGDDELVAAPPEPPGAPADAHPDTRGLIDHYRLPGDAFAGLRVLRRGRYLRLVPADHAPPGRVRTVTVGLPAVATNARHPRFSAPGAVAFGGGARAHVVDLTPEQARRFVGREDQPLAPAAPACTRGYLLVRRQGRFVLGNGLVRHQPEPILESHFPRAWLRGTPASEVR